MIQRLVRHLMLCDVDTAVGRLARDLEAGLLELRYDEITMQDRVTFIECVRDRHVRHALDHRRFDVANTLLHVADEWIRELVHSQG